MAYLGRAPANGFHSIQTISGDGSTTTFTLDYTVASDTAIIVSNNAVVLEPAHGYSLSGGGTSIVFTAAPASNVRTYIHFLGIAVTTNLLDVNGVEFVLDANADTSLTADTDDEIDIKVGGTDRSTIKATGFHNVDSVKFVAGTGDDMQMYHDGTNSYLTNATGALKIATETSGIALTIGHTTSEVTFGDNVTITGTLTVGGAVSFGDFDITNVGSIALDTITNDGTDITLDSSGDIILDSDGADVIFKDAGTEISRFTNSSSDFIIKTAVSDKDFIIKGNDGGAEVTAVTIDMSAAGATSFNGAITANAGVVVDNITIDGTEIDLSSGDLTVDVAGDIILDADGGEVLFHDATTAMGHISMASSNITLKSLVSDKDIIFQGNDGGSAITALTLDMSAAGAATFNNIITAVGTSVFTHLDISGDIDVDGTTNLDAVDIDGATQIDATFTSGVDGQGYDTKFFGDTSGAYLMWDTSADKLLTAGGALVDIVKDKLMIGGTAVTTTAAELNLLDTASANSVVNSKAVVYGSSGELAGVLSTAGQTSVTSLGTLTALTVDDVAVDGKVITMTGSSSDTAVLTAGTNGTLSIVTTDAAAAAANITITADGTAELAGTTVTLNSGGGVTLDADNGTITFADAGSSLGTITSSGYSGTAALATTLTITDNESTNENNVITFVAGAAAAGGNVGLESDGNLTYNPSTGTLSCTNIVTSGTHTVTDSVTMNASNAVVFEGSTADGYETTLTTVDPTADRTITLPNVGGTIPVLAAASNTQVTSTPEELNILDGATVVVGEVNYLDLGATGTGTAIASKAVILDSNKDYTGPRNLTINGTFSDGNYTFDTSGNVSGLGTIGSGAITTSGVLDITDTTDSSNATGDTGALRCEGGASIAKKLYVGTDLDVDGTTNLDVVDIDGAVDMALTLGVTGKITADAGIDIDNFNIDGTTIALSSGNLILDAAAEIHIDAGDVAKVIFKDDGTEMWRQFQSSSDVYIRTAVSDKDYYIQGNDGGSNITMVQFDASAAGAAVFNNDVTAFSDARLKENVETIDNALDKVCAMRGVTFNRIDNKDGGRQMGVIAQEIQDIVPEVVKINDDEDNTLSVSYGNMVGVLIEAIKELKQEINELKGE